MSQEDQNCPKSSSIKSTSITKRHSEFRFAPDIITSVKEYCDVEPPSLLMLNPNESLYQAENFVIENDGEIKEEIEQARSLKERRPSAPDSLNTSKNTSAKIKFTSMVDFCKLNEQNLLKEDQVLRLSNMSLTKYHIKV